MQGLMMIFDSYFINWSLYLLKRHLEIMMHHLPLDQLTPILGKIAVKKSNR